MTIALLSELLLKNDDSFRWLSLTNNEIGVPIPELTSALLRNVTLRKVSCHAGFLGSLILEDLMLLMETLAQLSHLQDLWLALPSRQARQSSAILQTILTSPQSHLNKLTLRGMDDAGCQVLAKALCQPTACMTDLQIRGTTSTTTTTSSRVTRQGILAIANMLKVNKSLQRLDLCYKGLDATSCQAIAQALKVNQTLQKLDLTTPNSNSNNNNTANNNTATTTGNRTTRKKESNRMRGYDALVEAMRYNYTLQHLQTPAEGQHKYMMDLMVKLNRTGARALMRNTTNGGSLEDILEVVQDYSHDVTAVYELLSMHPTMWDPNKATVQGMTPTTAALPNKDKAIAKINKKRLFFDVEKKKNYDAADMLANSYASSPPTRKSKPVMARWNENIFSNLEREKIRNFKRWTPTVIENINHNQPSSSPSSTAMAVASNEVGVAATAAPASKEQLKTSGQEAPIVMKSSENTRDVKTSVNSMIFKSSLSVSAPASMTLLPEERDAAPSLSKKAERTEVTTRPVSATPTMDAVAIEVRSFSSTNSSRDNPCRANTAMTEITTDEQPQTIKQAVKPLPFLETPFFITTDILAEQCQDNIENNNDYASWSAVTTSTTATSVLEFSNVVAVNPLVFSLDLQDCGDSDRKIPFDESHTYSSSDELNLAVSSATAVNYQENPGGSCVSNRTSDDESLVQNLVHSKPPPGEMNSNNSVASGVDRIEHDESEVVDGGVLESDIYSCYMPPPAGSERVVSMELTKAPMLGSAATVDLHFIGGEAMVVEPDT